MLAEHFVAVPVPQSLQEIVEMVRLVPQRVQRIVEQIGELSKRVLPQQRTSKRLYEQTVHIFFTNR